MGLKIAHFPNSPGADELRKEDESRGGGVFYTYTGNISQIMMINGVFSGISKITLL